MAAKKAAKKAVKKRDHLFKKGKSGNPNGRPARPKLPDKYTFKAAIILIDLGCCPFSVLAELALYARSEGVRCEAASQLARYVAGPIKPVDPVDPSEEKGVNLLCDMGGRPFANFKRQPE